MLHAFRAHRRKFASTFAIGPPDEIYRGDLLAAESCTHTTPRHRFHIVLQTTALFLICAWVAVASSARIEHERHTNVLAKLRRTMILLCVASLVRLPLSSLKEHVVGAAT